MKIIYTTLGQIEMKNLTTVGTKIILIICLVTLASCAQWQVGKTQATATAQEFADEALKVALWKLCKASPIGTIKRWIGGNTELASAYKVVCTESEQADVVDE